MSVKAQRVWTVLIIILGGIVGAVFIAPLVNVEIFIGIILGIIACILILPFFFRDPYGMQAAKVMEIGVWESLLHPTNLPKTVAMIWFVFILGLAYALHINIGDFKPGMNITFILLIPSCL